MYSRNGILSFLVSCIYITVFLLFYIHVYVMISVCTKVEIKFEKEVEKKTINNENCELNYLNSNNWKNKLYIINNRHFVEFIDNLVEFYEPIEDSDKERIFLTKH